MSEAVSPRVTIVACILALVGLVGLLEVGSWGLWAWAYYVGGTFDEGCRSVCLDGPATWEGWRVVWAAAVFMTVVVLGFASVSSDQARGRASS